MTILVACGLRREAAIIKRVGVIPVVGGGSSERLENQLEDRITEYASEGWQFDAVLSCGVAGALDPALRAGNVVIGDLFSGEGRSIGLRSETPETQGSGLRRRTLADWLADQLPDAHRGTVAGTDAIIGSATEKAALYARTGAIAVDMESHIAARVAARHGLPFAILRTISDTADHALPPAALVGMKPDGGMALGAVLASLGAQPGTTSRTDPHRARCRCGVCEPKPRAAYA